MEKKDVLDRVLQDISRIQGDKLFVRDATNDNEYSFSQFFGVAQQVGRQLKEKYAEVVVCKENGFELCVLLFACIVKNITIIPIDPRKEQKELQEILKNHPHARLLIDKSGDRYRDDLDYTVPEKRADAITGLFDQVDLEKDYLITYTSGTTGIAKGVIHSVGSLLMNAYIFGHALGLKGCCLAHIMPMTYMAGILNSLILPFVMGGQIVLFPRFDVKTMAFFWKKIDIYGIDTIWMSPTMLNMICCLDKKGDKAEYISENNVVFCVGTAPLPQNVKERFERTFHTRVYQSYGSTELLLLTTESAEVDGSCNSVGKPLEGVKIRLEDKELLINAPWRFKGYTNESSEPCCADGYHMTGDMGMFQGDLLFINGRRKETIIRGGMKINPHEIEKVVYQVSGVKECKIGPLIVDDEEKICCYLALDDPRMGCIEKIKQMVADELGRSYNIDHFVTMKELPKNLNGKIDSSRLRQYSEDLIKNGRGES